MQCNANGVRHSFGKSLHPEEAYNVNSWTARLGHCMGQIEDGLKCMYSETGTKKVLSGRKKRERNLHGEMKKMFVGNGEVRQLAQDRPSRSGNVVRHSRAALNAAKTRFRCLFFPSPRSYYHLPARHPHQTAYLQRMDCVATQHSPVG